MSVRGLEQEFIEDLKTGRLQDFLKVVKENEDIVLAIRKNFINLYYKGGNLLRIKPTKSGYNCKFDVGYCLRENKEKSCNYYNLANIEQSDYKTFSKNLKLMMSEMDEWFSIHPKEERRYQQRLLRDNQEIVDIEYQIGLKSRLDMLAYKDGVLYIIENKYGVKAISSKDSNGKDKSGLWKHYDDMQTVVANNESLDEMKESVVNVYNQKNELFDWDLEKISKDDIKEIKYLFILAEYEPGSEKWDNELKLFKDEEKENAYVIFNPPSTKIDFASGVEFSKAERP